MKYRRYCPPIPADVSKLSNAAYPAPPLGVKRTPQDYGLGHSANRLPIAPESTINNEMKILFYKHRFGFLSVAAFTLFTVAASLIPPRVFGNFLQDLQSQPTDNHSLFRLRSIAWISRPRITVSPHSSRYLIPIYERQRHPDGRTRKRPP